MDNIFLGKKILVTGASGIIGISLCSTLRRLGCQEVHINYLNELPHEIAAILDGFYSHKRFDICDLEQIQKLEMYDIIFFCSGYGQPKKFTREVEKTYRLNTAPLSVLASKVKDGGKLVYISTSEVYVNTDAPNETTPITIRSNNPRNCYIIGKLVGEYYLSLVNQEGRIKCHSVRVCLGYGQGFKLDDERVLYELIFKALRNKRIQLLDSGSDLRRYIYIQDVIDMLLQITSSGSQYLYNIGGIKEVSILEIANKIGEMTGAEIIIGSDTNRLSGSPKSAYVDMTRYTTEFGSINYTSFENGLAHCIKWARRLVHKASKSKSVK